MELSRRLAPLMITAVAEEKQLLLIVAAGEGQAELLEQLAAGAAFTRQAKSAEDLRKIGLEQRQQRDDRVACQKKIQQAEIAGLKVRWLRLWLPELFAEEVPAHGGHMSMLQPADETSGAASKLGVTAWFAVPADSWRRVGQAEDETSKRRKYVSFSPLSPNTKFERLQR